MAHQLEAKCSVENCKIKNKRPKITTSTKPYMDQSRMKLILLCTEKS